MNETAIKTKGTEFVSEETLLFLREAIILQQPKEFSFPEINPEWKFKSSDVRKYLWAEDKYIDEFRKFFNKILHQSYVE